MKIFTLLALSLLAPMARAATVGDSCAARPGRSNYQETVYTLQANGIEQECGRVYKAPVPNGTWRATVVGSTTPHDAAAQDVVMAWLLAQPLPTFPAVP